MTVLLSTGSLSCLLHLSMQSRLHHILPFCDDNHYTGIMRKFTINQDVFSEISSESVAYSFGFLLADGWLTTGNRGVSVATTETDISVLEYIRKTFGSNAPFHEKSRSSGFNSGGKLVILNLCSTKICSDLISLGLHRRKGADGTTLPDIPKHLMRHVLRGLFDGDGCISERQFWLVGSQMLLEQVQGIAKSMDVTLSIGMSNGYPRISAGKRSAEFLRWLYEDCEFALPRKLNIYNQHWKYPRTLGSTSIPVKVKAASSR